MKKKREEYESLIKFLLYDNALLKLIVLIVIHLMLTNVLGYFPDILQVSIVINLLTILIGVYFVAAIVYLLKTRVDQLLSPHNFRELISAYVIFILVILLVFSTFLNLVEMFKLGYITYGTCSDTFNADLIPSDSMRSHNAMYFSAITFFSVGYGDICPMGWAKFLSIIIAFTGHLISVIFVALVINNYFRLQGGGNKHKCNHK